MSDDDEEGKYEYNPSYEDYLENVINDAIDILDGNMEPIDWKNQDYPELLRKLSEHLESL